MKRSLILNLLLWGSYILNAQAPQKISYQAVIRNANNIILASKSIGLKVSILKAGAVPEKVYEESQNPVTNINGLMSLQIGAGSVLSGDISKINWASGKYFIKTEIDPEGGSNYVISGLTELTSVPFALFAATSGSLEIESGNYTRGPKGDTGATGLTGETGEQGEPGEQGVIGVTGAMGPSGPQGNTGGVGATGVQGPQGNEGMKGEVGIQGLHGLVGANGLVGQPGPQGSQGIAGVIGLTGLQGLPGVDGLPGVAGPQGLMGATGLTGSQGIPGMAGIDGLGGIQGLPGANGSVGVAGPAGVAGPQGLSGADGVSNVAGPAGPAGPAGVAGPQGLTGANGTSGAAGSQGPQGPAGEFSGNFSGEVIFEGDFSANGSSNSIGGVGNKSGQGVRIGNGRFTFNKPNEPVLIHGDYTISPGEIFDSGIVVSDRRARLFFPAAADLSVELPTKKAIGDIISLMLISVEQALTIVPGDGGTLIGSDQVGAGDHRIIYIRYTDINRGSYIIY